MVDYVRRDPPSLVFQYAGSIDALSAWVNAIPSEEFWGPYGGPPLSMTVEETDAGGFRITLTWPDPIDDIVRVVEGAAGDYVVWLRQWYGSSSGAAYVGEFLTRSSSEFPGVEFEPVN